MKLSLILISFLHSSCALYICLEAPKTELRESKRTAQNAATKSLAKLLATDTSDIQPPKKSIPWWKLPNTDNGEMNAFTGQQFYPFDDEDGGDNDGGGNIMADDNTCPLSQCDNSGVLGKSYCGAHARCLKGHCQCNLGWKPVSYTRMARGWIGLEALTIWTDMTRTGCNVRCDTLSCSEVPQVRGCFDHHDDNSGKNQGYQGVETTGLHLTAIKAPGADAVTDSMAGVAGAGSVG